jgi:RNA polymerase sigma factor (sigma-70 family)
MEAPERFPKTSWTLLERAREQSADGARARGDFAQRYYRPVEAFLLVLVQDGDQARELAQEFFARLIESGKPLEQAQREKGSFRNYLKRVLRNLVIDYYRRKRTENLLTHPDQANDGAWENIDLPSFPAAEAAFHHAWVKVKLGEALTRVRDRCHTRKQEVHLHLFEARYLSDTDPAPSWEELGARYGMDQKAARERADTVARHFRLVLRGMLRNEVTAMGGRSSHLTDEAIDDEIKALLSPLED